MGSIDGRLRKLEERAGGGEDEEERISREAMARVTDEEVSVIWDLLERLPEEVELITEDEELTDKEWAALMRYEELCEEVRDEFRAPLK